ncbi:hypothetical protein [Olsenella sp. AM30-3LB]|uniref:hypothetical protein n=1 Tax=Olsenella sp. AM30-3LB TaxID=2292359 RepID=UPI001314EC37|nr:hypothetical protein [Olsenella sp. AM30-3LB]
MEKRHRAVAAVAAGAVVVALGAGAARSCAVTSEPTAGSDPRDAEGSTAWVEVVPGTGSSGDAEEGGAGAAAELESREWMGAADSSLRMTASGGRLVETDGTETYTSSYVVTYDDDGSCGLAVTRADGTVVQATVTIEGEGDDERLRCEQLQTAFDWVPAPKEGEVRVTGVDDQYLALVGGDEGALDLAVSLWASEHVPGASEAAFDGEVYLDTRSGSVTATFTCDDPGRSIASVTWAGGAFSVTG